MWSEDGPCYIIAEAGSNHDGDYNQAESLVAAAGYAKCDAIKFQLIPPFGVWWMPHLRTIASAYGMDLLATPFDVEAVEYLDRFNVAAIKIASPEIVNLPLICEAVKTGRPLILSTGMASMDDVEAALEFCDGSKTALLQCTTRYPTPYDQVNLRAMETLRDDFGPRTDAPLIGLSDHSLGIAVPIAAAALEAVIIEKHFTLDRTLEGPDHSYALEPDELKAMVKGIREVEQALGDGRKGPVEGELVEARGRQLTWQD